MFTINDPINNLQLQKKPLDTAVEDFFQTSFNNVDDLLLNIADKHNIPSFNKYLSQIEEIKKIAEECNKTGKKTLLIVRNERLVQYLEKYLDKKQIDNNNNINIQSECFCKKSAEELDSYEFNGFSELRIFDIPRFGSSNGRGTNECNFIKYISKKYPQIKVEFSNFSRKFLDNEVLYKFIEENFDESITIENNNERIQDLIDSDEHGSYKGYQLQLDNDIKSPDKFISHVEDLLIESLEEGYNNKRVILYAENIGQKKRILKKINKSDKLNKGNFKIIISDEIGYHDEWKEEAVLILDPNPSDDKVIKIVRASILNKKNNEIPIITCNNEIPLTSKDGVIRNKSNQSIELENLEDNNVPKTKKKKSNGKGEQILVKRKSIQETLEINGAINSATKITDFNSMTELGLIELVKLELSKQNPPVIDEAILINIGIPKLTIKIPALSELFERRKIRKTKTSITEFSKIFFLQKEKAYYYKKLKGELKKEGINNYLDFIGIPIRKRPRKKNSDKNENIIDGLSLQRLLIKPYFNNYIHTELKLSKITDYGNPHKHITANYLFGDDYLKKSKGTAIKELNHKGVNSGLHLLSLIYSFKSILKPFSSVAGEEENSLLSFINTTKGLKTVVVASGISHYEGGQIKNLSKEQIILLVKTLFPHEYENLLYEAIQKAQIEINTFIKNSNGNINSTLFKEYFWPKGENNLIWVRLLISILSDTTNKINEGFFSTNRDKFNVPMFNRFMLLFEDEQKGEQNKTNKIIDKTTERVISTFKIDPNVDNSIKSTGQQILESNISNNTINFQELCEGWGLDSMSKNGRNIIALLESNSITANDLEFALEEYTGNSSFYLEELWKEGEYVNTRKMLEGELEPDNFFELILESKNKRKN